MKEKRFQRERDRRYSVEKMQLAALEVQLLHGVLARKCLVYELVDRHMLVSWLTASLWIAEDSAQKTTGLGPHTPVALLVSSRGTPTLAKAGGLNQSACQKPQGSRGVWETSETSVLSLALK